MCAGIATSEAASMSTMRYGRFPLAAVVCIVRLVEIVEIDEPLRFALNSRERIFGNYEDGRYAWFLEMVERFDKPIPAKGNRLLWEWQR
jgi:hypothetical protein